MTIMVAEEECTLHYKFANRMLKRTYPKGTEFQLIHDYDTTSRVVAPGGIIGIICKARTINSTVFGDRFKWQ